MTRKRPKSLQHAKQVLAEIDTLLAVPGFNFQQASHQIRFVGRYLAPQVTIRLSRYLELCPDYRIQVEVIKILGLHGHYNAFPQILTAADIALQCLSYCGGNPDEVTYPHFQVLEAALKSLGGLYRSTDRSKIHPNYVARAVKIVNEVLGDPEHAGPINGALFAASCFQDDSSLPLVLAWAENPTVWQGISNYAIKMLKPFGTRRNHRNRQQIQEFLAKQFIDRNSEATREHLYSGNSSLSPHLYIVDGSKQMIDTLLSFGESSLLTIVGLTQHTNNQEIQSALTAAFDKLTDQSDLTDLSDKALYAAYLKDYLKWDKEG